MTKADTHNDEPPRRRERLAKLFVAVGATAALAFYKTQTRANELDERTHSLRSQLSRADTSGEEHRIREAIEETEAERDSWLIGRNIAGGMLGLAVAATAVFDLPGFHREPRRSRKSTLTKEGRKKLELLLTPESAPHFCAHDNRMQRAIIDYVLEEAARTEWVEDKTNRVLDLNQEPRFLLAMVERVASRPSTTLNVELMPFMQRGRM